MKSFDLAGKEFGKWVVKYKASSTKRGEIRWMCVCVCGTERVVMGTSLRYGKSKSCGCLNKLNLIGREFGRLTVINKLPDSEWLCSCECGGEKISTTSYLQSGDTKSCGCLFKEYSTKHGLSSHPLYPTWKTMNARCYNKLATGYKNYGGRGIQVCDRWNDPITGCLNFIKDMGDKPSKNFTIERSNNNLNYCKSNCYWATYEEQNNNRRNNRLISFGNKTKTISQWEKETGVNSCTIIYRLNSGWSIKEALTI